MKTALYRHHDKAGRLLYVGITNHVFRRLAQHGERSAWFHEISSISVDWLPTREAALRAEREAIKREKPLHNVRLVEAPAEKRAVAWGIFHPASSRFDGWYFDEEDARDVLAYFREQNPRDVFLLTSRTHEQRANTGRRPLRPTNAEEWSATARHAA